MNLETFIKRVDAKVDSLEKNVLDIVNAITEASQQDNKPINHIIHWNATTLIEAGAQFEAAQRMQAWLEHLDTIEAVREALIAELTQQGSRLVNCSTNRTEPIEKAAKVEFYAELLNDLRFCS